jgi:hypothetical protein
LLTKEVTMLDDWTTALARELGLDDAVDTALLLGLARDAARLVERPAAPLTTFMVGLAAGRAGGSAADVQRAVAVATALATSWSPAEPA